MKPFLSLIVAIFIATAAFTAKAQTTAPPVAQTPAVPTKIAVIDTDAFADTKAGIKRLISAYNQISNELARIRQDITTKSTRYDELGKKSVAGTLTQAEADEAEGLKRDIQRLQEDGQRQAEKLGRERTGPILTDIGNAIKTYAKQRGFDVVIDVSKLQGSFLVLNDNVDITDGFILDYNAKNPGSATATPPKQP
jgi:Skp family chaperone for outer membrane proteins